MEKNSPRGSGAFDKAFVQQIDFELFSVSGLFRYLSFEDLALRHLSPNRHISPNEDLKPKDLGPETLGI